MVRSESILPSFTVDLPEELSSFFHTVRSPKLLEYTEKAQCLRFRLFNHVLLIPKSSLQPRRASQKVCVVNRVRPGLFNMSVCVVEPAFPGKQACQEGMNPEQLLVGVEGRSNHEGYFEMVNGLLRVALSVIYFAKSTVTCADPKSITFL